MRVLPESPFLPRSILRTEEGASWLRVGRNELEQGKWGGGVEPPPKHLEDADPTDCVSSRSLALSHWDGKGLLFLPALGLEQLVH